MLSDFFLCVTSPAPAEQQPLTSSVNGQPCSHCPQGQFLFPFSSFLFPSLLRVRNMTGALSTSEIIYMWSALVHVEFLAQLRGEAICVNTNGHLLWRLIWKFPLTGSLCWPWVAASSGVVWQRSNDFTSWCSQSCCPLPSACVPPAQPVHSPSPRLLNCSDSQARDWFDGEIHGMYKQDCIHVFLQGRVVCFIRTCGNASSSVFGFLTTVITDLSPLLKF